MFEHFWNIMKLYICCHSWKDKEIQRGPSLLNKNQKVCIQLQVCSDCISLNLQQWESLNSCWKAQPDHVSCEGRHRRPMGGREASWGGRGVDGNEQALGNWVLDDCTQCVKKSFLSRLVCLLLLFAFCPAVSCRQLCLLPVYEWYQTARST